MAGYLDQYGAGDEQRAKLIKRIVFLVLAVVILTTLPWYLFKNHAEEKQVRNFLGLLRNKDYAEAYRAWGCGTDPKACSGYSFDRFQEDWGPKSSADPNLLSIRDSQSCGSGVMLTVRANRDRQDTLWVEKNGVGLSFAPDPVCPTKSFWSMAAHLTIGKLRRPFLNW